MARCVFRGAITALLALQSGVIHSAFGQELPSGSYSIPTAPGHMALDPPGHGTQSGTVFWQERAMPVEIEPAHDGGQLIIRDRRTEEAVPYERWTLTEEQAYPGTLVVHEWRPTLADIEAPAFRRLLENNEQPGDIIYKDYSVVNLGNYVDADTLENTWRIVVDTSDFEQARSHLQAVGIPAEATNVLTFDDVEEDSVAVLDIDLRQLSSEQLEQLISTPVPVGFAYSVPMQLNRYSVKFTLSTSLRGNDLESVFSEHLARTGIEFQIDRAAGNEYGTRAAYHASGFAGAVKERIALWDNENLWIRHALFIRLAEEGGNQIMFFDLTDLGCRRGPRTALPSALTFDDDCVRANVTPANLGAVFADSLKDGLGATSLVLQR